METPEQDAPAPAEGEGGTEEAAAPDYSAITDHLDSRLNEFGEQLTSQVDQRLAALTPAEEYDQQQQEPGVDPNLLYDDQGNMDDAQAQQLLQQMIAQGTEQAVGPLQAEIEDLRMERGAERLEAQYPELQDPKTAENLIAQAAQQAAALGNDRLGRDPAFLEMVHKANRVDQLAASETPADGTQPSEMEGGGGAAPPVPEDDVQDRIVQAAGATPAGLFWGAAGSRRG